MGSRGPMPKPADQRRRRNRKPQEVQARPARRPRADAKWTDTTKGAWSAYWSSDLARAALDVDMQAIRRLFALYDQYERAMGIVSQALLVKGSTGQLRTNPLADHALKLEGVILRLENELGLTPMARVRLGIRIRAAEEPEPERRAESAYRKLRVIAGEDMARTVV